MLKYLKIDLGNIRHNIDQIKSRIDSEIGLMAIVKSNAYGHGALEISKAISDRVNFFGVDDFNEASELREGGVEKPILILGAFERDNLEEISKLGISVSIYSKESLKIAIESKLFLKIQLKIDTGMHRLGIKPSQAEYFAKKIADSDRLIFEGLWSHFADSGSVKNDSYSKKQIKLFDGVVKNLDDLNINPKYIHLSNSSGLIRFKSAWHNLVRSGVMIYGLSSLEENLNLDLRPALEFKSKIVQVRKLDKGEPIGYGLTNRLTKKGKIAVIPVGYKDGYPRQLSNKGEVLIAGRRCLVVGKICMRMMMVNVSKLDKVGVGDEVVLIGGQLSDRIRTDKLAEKIDTNKHEIISRLDSQLIRIYE